MIKRIQQSASDKEELAATRIDPSTLADDFFDYTNAVIQKPWGHEYLIYANNDAAVWVLHIKEGNRTSMHCHQNKKTSLSVLSGKARSSFLTDVHELRIGDGLVIDKGVFHSTEAVSPMAIVMEIETPTNKKDLVRLRDEYGRVGKRYEGHEYHRVFENSIQHFHNKEERYHTEKPFGECTLAVARFADIGSFKEALRNKATHAVHVLKGCIVNRENQCIMEVGDAMLWNNLTAMSDLLPLGELELLLVHKN